MDRYSPAWLELKINSLNQKLFVKLLGFLTTKEKLFFWFTGGFGALLVFNYDQLIDQYFSIQYQTLYHFGWISNKGVTFSFFLFVAPLLWFIRIKSELFQVLAFNFLLLVSFFVTVDLQNLSDSWIQISIILFGILFIIFPMIALRKSTKTVQFGYLFISVFGSIFLIDYLQNSLANIFSSNIYIQSNIGRYLIPLSLAITEYHYLIRFQSTVSALSYYLYLLSPANYLNLYPLRFADRQWTPHSLEVRLKGASDILVGFLAFFAVSVVFKIFPRTNTLPTGLELFGTGLKMSFVYFLSSFGCFRFVSGFGRWLGYSLPDNTNFALLAVSPMDSWRRWSVYLYDWMMHFVYLPSKKLLGFHFVTLLFTFSILFLLHFMFQIPEILSGNYESKFTQQRVINNYLFFTSQGLVIYLSLFFSKLWPSNQKVTGWLGVFITQALLGLSHILVI